MGLIKGSKQKDLINKGIYVWTDFKSKLNFFPSCGQTYLLLSGISICSAVGSTVDVSQKRK